MFSGPWDYLFYIKRVDRSFLNRGPLNAVLWGVTGVAHCFTGTNRFNIDYFDVVLLIGELIYLYCSRCCAVWRP